MGPQGYKADLRSRGRNGNCSGGSEGQNLTSNLYATSGVPKDGCPNALRSDQGTSLSQGS